MGRMRRKTYKSYYNKRSLFNEFMSPIYELLNRLMDGLISIYVAFIGIGILLVMLNYKLIVQWLNSHWLIVGLCLSILISVIIGAVFLLKKLKASNRR